MAAPFEEWYNSMPVVTKYYMTICFATTFAVYLDVITPLQLYLNFRSVFYEYEIWRLFTNFIFYDYFGLNFFFHMFFVIRHCQMLEESSFRGRTGDFVYLWLFCGVILTMFNLMVHVASKYNESIPAQIMFLGPSLAFAVVYIWSRRNPHMRMSFLGLFTFNAPYLPWVLMGFGLMLVNRHSTMC